MRTVSFLIAFCAMTATAIAQVEPRTNDLGISGPTMTALGGPGKHFIKYNSRTDAGEAVRKGLMPPIQPILDAQIRDAVINIGHDGRYYLTGSTGDEIWRTNDGIELWVSDDLKKWEYIGLVWSFDRDGTWQRAWRDHNGPSRAIWAPELHYIKGNYYLTLSMHPGDRGLLKSTTGKPEGPYVNALANDGKWDGNIDASLFLDDDGKVYVVWGGGSIARMKDDMSGMAEKPRHITLLNPDTIPANHARTCSQRRNCADIGHEGAFVFKKDGLYYFTAADTYQGRYSSMVAVSENIYGPYRWRHEGVPCSGGTSYFRDHEGRWWCTFFGNDWQAPFRSMPAMIRVDFSSDGHVLPHRDQPLLNQAERIQWAVQWDKVWKKKY